MLLLQLKSVNPCNTAIVIYWHIRRNESKRDTTVLYSYTHGLLTAWSVRAEACHSCQLSFDRADSQVREVW